jgi:hypothetical protein
VGGYETLLSNEDVLHGIANGHPLCFTMMFPHNVLDAFRPSRIGAEVGTELSLGFDIHSRGACLQGAFPDLEVSVNIGARPNPPTLHVITA